ncbi:MAG TPA: YeeE/YedE thiosulfate transporter family protein, partial [Gammaproteobacteria bacterium]
MKNHLLYGLFGLAMGMILSFIGFTSFDEVHKMFTLQDFRLIAAFAGAVGLLVIGFAIISRQQQIPKKKFNKGTIPGSILFGAGWAITGSCPSIALVQLGEGQLAAVF